MLSKIATLRFLRLPLLAFLLLQRGDAASQSDPQPPAGSPGQILHISPGGSDQSGDGSETAPLATVTQALARLTPGQPATIRLLPGVYREQVTLPAAKGGAPPATLKIEGSDRGEAIFEGGEPITKWSALPPPGNGLFRIENAVSQSIRSNEGLYYDVWDAEARIRYRKQADLAGVAAYPASIAVEDEKHLLIHTSDGKAPRNLWRSASAFAIVIERDRVVLENLTFRNYTGGGSAHGVAIGRNVRDTVVRECRFENIICGILNDGSHTKISGIRMREVSRGVESRGEEVTVEDCFIEAATGRFTFSDNNRNRQNGIRIYYPSVGGTVRRNVTAGFYTGLYIKTASSLESARPILVEHNTFVDGINFGPKKHLRTTLRSNLIGPIKAAPGIRRLMGIGVAFEHNYFFAPDFREISPLEPATNVTGPDPFANLVEGDLHTTDPRIAEFQMGAPAARRPWLPAIRRLLAQENAAQAPLPPFRILAPLKDVASRQGALLFATLSVPAQEVFLKVRRSGERDWIKVPGQINQPTEPEVSGAPAPVEREKATPATPYLFDLSGGQLTPDTPYEAVLSARSKEGKNVESAVYSFQTVGKAKVIYVDAKAPASDANGTVQHPWPQLQQALDQALPGDTIELAKGVYTRPAILLHGGTAEHPIVIRGESRQTTLLDGGKEFSILLKLENAPHVTLTDLTFRWFGDHGLMALESPSLRVERCHFQNSVVRRGANGRAGLHLLKSPHAHIAFNSFTTAEIGALLVDSPAFTFQSNTAFANLYSGIQINNSARDSVMTHNAFTFTGNGAADLLERDRAAWESFTCNFNNYGNRLNNGPAAERPENDFRPKPHYGKISGKAILRAWIALPESAGEVAGKSFYSMRAWREFSGKDGDSIFADPDYIDPLNNDFRVRPNSPHFLADGTQIGAEGRLPSPSASIKP